MLKSLAALEARGATTTAVAARSGLPRATVHRLLSVLREQGLTDRDEASGHWHLGPELYVLGVQAARRFDVAETARPHVSRLAQVTGESAFFSVRRGDETVCVVREDGDFPLRSFVLFEGARFPLGVVSAGLVVLAYLPDDEVDAYLAGTDLVADHGPDHAEAALRERIALARLDGYATNPGLVVEGSWGMAAAVFDSYGRPAAALTLTGVQTRFADDRRPGLGRLLLREAHQLSNRLPRAS